MSIGSADGRRARTPASERDRTVAAETVRRHAAEGLLSTREADDRLEQVFRARTQGDLDAVLAGLSRPAHVMADIVSTHGLSPSEAPKPVRPWWQGPVMIAAGAIALWLIVWIVTGGSVVWLVLAILISVLGFVFRLGRSYKKELGLAPRGRRARSGRRSLM